MSYEINKSRILAKHDEIMRKARELFPAFRYAPEVQVYFYETGKTAGMAHGHFRVGYNIHIFSQDMERFLNSTVAHEIAHIVCSYTNTDRGHGKTWKRVCRLLGGDGQRCYAGENLQHKMVRTRKRYEYRATCGTVMMVSDVIHGKIQRGTRGYFLRATNGKLLPEGFTGRTQ